MNKVTFYDIAKALNAPNAEKYKEDNIDPCCFVQKHIDDIPLALFNRACNEYHEERKLNKAYMSFSSSNKFS